MTRPLRMGLRWESHPLPYVACWVLLWLPTGGLGGQRVAMGRPWVAKGRPEAAKGYPKGDLGGQKVAK